jgi:WD40 repeat protein
MEHWQMEAEEWIRFHAIAFTPDGEQLLTSSWEDGGLTVWNVEAGERVGTIDDFTAPIMEKVLLPDNRAIAVKLYGGSIELWDLATGEEKQAFHGGNAEGGIAVSPDGRLLASGAGEREAQEIMVWSVDSGETVAQFPVEHEYVSELVFSPDSRFLLSFSDGEENSPIILWNATSWTKAREYWPSNVEVRSYSIARFDFTPDSQMLVAGLGGELGTRVLVWNVQQASGPVILFDDTGTSMRDVVFTPDGELLGLFYLEEGRNRTSQGQLSLWDYDNRQEVARTPFDIGLYGYTFDTAFTSDGQAFLTQDLREGVVHLVDIVSGQLLEAQTISGLGPLVSPDGRLIVTDNTRLGQVTVWGIPGGR